MKRPATFQRKQLSNNIAEHIRAGILDGSYPPGKFLRTEEVAHNLEVSATPVREAFMALAAEGFVEHAERRGFRVAALSRRDFEDLYSLMAIVSGRLAERSATSMSAEDLDELARVHERMKAAARAGESEDVERLNDEFHRVINRAARSSKLAWILLSILKYVPKRYYAGIGGMTEMLVDQHERILLALQQHDAALAFEAMHEHEWVTMQAVMDHLGSEALFDSGTED